ncbi:MAG: hypothetical protein BWX78_01374 [Firmicutes bacterium ADurb.Bin099]|nr:MAG: hypothetical protein BWX78_01374 [Firmicutes bacterium ADurb.Bin099]
MNKSGYFTVPENGHEERIELGFVPKVVLIEYVAKDDPDVGTVIIRIFIDATGTTVYWYPHIHSETESRNFRRYIVNEDWLYGTISHFGNYIGFKTPRVNDFIGKTFHYYATNEEAGTFTSSSYQYGVVNVPKTSEDVNIIVSLPFGPDNLTTAFYVDCVEDMPTPTFDGAVRMSSWSIPSENIIYSIDPDSYPGDQGETGIINSHDNYFVFRSNAENTHGINCTYYLIPQISDYLVPEEAHGYYIKNIISDSPNMQDARHKYFYKYKSNSKLALYAVKKEKGFDLVLKGTSGISEILYSTSDDKNYNEVQTTETHFLRDTQVWSGGEKYYSLVWDTNIYIFEADDTHSAEERAQMYIDGDLDEEEADNYDKVAQRENLKLDGKIGDKVNTTAVSISDLSFTAGTQVYAMTNLQKGSFFNKLFNTQTTPIEDLLNGTQLFGSDEIGAIQGLHYIPFQASDFCTMGSSQFINIGSYRLNMGEDIATCLKNNKFLSVGGARFKRTYNDYRDFEPFCKLYVGLPYIGIKELQLSKYLDTTISVHYCCDITTGALLVRIMANKGAGYGTVLMDSFDGNCATYLPITAKDKAQQTNAIMTGLLNTAGSSISAVGTVAGAAGGIMGVANAAAAGRAGAAIGGAISIGGSLLSSVASPVINGYSTLQNTLSAPITTRGSYAGNLGNFGLTHVTFYFAWLNTVVPENEISLIGKPSNKGGAVGNFSGFLQVSAFNMTSGFGGTDTELEEIYSLLRSGIYVS